jgi:hypothetical protein
MITIKMILKNLQVHYVGNTKKLQNNKEKANKSMMKILFLNHEKGIQNFNIQELSFSLLEVVQIEKS